MKKQDRKLSERLQRRLSCVITGRERPRLRHYTALMRMDGASALENGEYQPSGYNCPVADINKKGNTRNIALHHSFMRPKRAGFMPTLLKNYTGRNPQERLDQAEGANTCRKPVRK